MFWTVVFAIFVVYYMTQTERYMCQYVCLIHFLGQTDKTSSMPMFVSRKYKCVWYPSNQFLKNSQCVGPQKCIPITNEVCPIVCHKEGWQQQVIHQLRPRGLHIKESGYLLSIFSWFVRAHLSISQHLKSGLMMRTHVPF